MSKLLRKSQYDKIASKLEDLGSGFDIEYKTEDDIYELVVGVDWTAEGEVPISEAKRLRAHKRLIKTVEQLEQYLIRSLNKVQTIKATLTGVL